MGKLFAFLCALLEGLGALVRGLGGFDEVGRLTRQLRGVVQNVVEALADLSLPRVDVSLAAHLLDRGLGVGGGITIAGIACERFTVFQAVVDRLDQLVDSLELFVGATGLFVARAKLSQLRNERLGLFDCAFHVRGAACRLESLRGPHDLCAQHRIAAMEYQRLTGTLHSLFELGEHRLGVLEASIFERFLEVVVQGIELGRLAFSFGRSGRALR